MLSRERANVVKDAVLKVVGKNGHCDIRIKGMGG
eukprot:CAMPEP_0185785888 /NCGR_PEP_ID=MMETSP1174-20130828/132220_1 /TAXON_ID=35687 /ORGANISM="Dictyocha speculum, Strain CCMP1381" /LENGTH=33 /DNA_ID= /DNA_START= /DNA_END= /DNA_ORIENTATION=